MPAITLGTSSYGRLFSAGQRDGYVVSLQAGVQYEVRMHGIGSSELTDPYLRLYNASGVLLTQNDDANIWSGANGQDSRLQFTPTTTGVYKIEAGAFNDTGTGDYLLTAVTANTQGMVFTPDEISWQLTSNFQDWWGSPPAASRFNVGNDSALTVNITGLTAAGQYLAVQALQAWSNVTGIAFVQTAGAAEITFDDNQSGAFAGPSSISGRTILASTVNIGTGWLSSYGTGLNSYSFQTYIHEIGHALGLGHAGNYNGSATYGSSNYYLNDSWTYSLMSYMSPAANTFLSDSYGDFVLTPQIADVVAIQYLYGNRTAEFSWDTTYGYGSNTGDTAIDNFVNYSGPAALTVFDGGGTDTLNFGNYSVGGQQIDLHPGAFSNVLGGTMNLAIAFGVVIENAIGGAGGDTITGNDWSNTLTGKGGNDTIDGAGGIDFAVFGGVRADYSLTSLGGTSVRVSGTDGIDTVSNVERLKFDNLIVSWGVTDAWSDASGAKCVVGSYENGTGADIAVIRPSQGGIATYTANGNGTFGSVFAPESGKDWVSWPHPKMVSADFDGNHVADIVTVHPGQGGLAVYLGGGDGSFFAVMSDQTATHSDYCSWPDPDLLTGDFTGDGRADIAVLNPGQGGIASYVSNGNGTFSAVFSGQGASHTDWCSWSTPDSIVGDFDGNGRADIAVVNPGQGGIASYLSNGNGTFTAVFSDQSATHSDWCSWFGAQLVAGDFDGNGRADLAVFNPNQGGIASYLSNGNGTFSAIFSAQAANHTDWCSWSNPQIVTGDFDGNGKTDIAVVNPNQGGIATYFSNGNGLFTAAFSAQPGTDWVSWPNPQLLAGDFNGDGRTDLCAMSPNQGGVAIYLSNGSGGYSPVFTGTSAGLPVLPGQQDLTAEQNLMGQLSLPGAPDVPVAQESAAIVSSAIDEAHAVGLLHDYLLI